MHTYGLEVHHAPSAAPIPQILYTMKDSNFHAEALDPKSNVSANFTNGAFCAVCLTRTGTRVYISDRSLIYCGYQLRQYRIVRLNRLELLRLATGAFETPSSTYSDTDAY